MLGFGIVTVTVLLTVVLPRLFTMLQEMLSILPLPTLILLKVSGILHHQWPWFLLGLAAVVSALRWYLRTSKGVENWDRIKLRLPVLGPVFHAAALTRLPIGGTPGSIQSTGVVCVNLTTTSSTSRFSPTVRDT